MPDDKETVEVEEEGDDPSLELQEPPSMTPGNVMGVIRKKGLMGAMKDEGMGPHMHLLAIMGVVILIAIGVGVMSAL